MLHQFTFIQICLDKPDLFLLKSKFDSCNQRSTTVTYLVSALQKHRQSKLNAGRFLDPVDVCANSSEHSGIRGHGAGLHRPANDANHDAVDEEWAAWKMPSIVNLINPLDPRPYPNHLEFKIKF